MTDRELKSMSKVQMLSLLYEQEEEIAQLKAELARPRLNTGASLVEEIVLATQDAADSYLKSIQSHENDKISGIAKLENDARNRYEEAERFGFEAKAQISEAVTDLNQIFIGLKELVDSVHLSFREKISESPLSEYIYSEK